MTLTLGNFGNLNPSPIHGWNVGLLDFIPVSVDATGAINTAGGGGGSSVDQGTGGLSPWLVTGPLTDAQLRATPIDVNATLDTTGLALETKQDTGNTALAAIQSAVELIDNFISGARGLVTEDNSAAIKSDLDTLAGKDFATQTTLALIQAKTDNLDAALSTLATAANQTTLNATDFATSAKQTTAQVALDALLAGLVLTQGTDATDLAGPLVHAVVSESPHSYLDDELRPLSLTAEGRLRVSTYPALIDQVWQGTFANPWETEYPSVADSDVPHGGLSYV